MYQQLGYTDENAKCPVATAVSDKILSLPVHPGLTEKDLMYIVEIVNNIYKMKVGVIGTGTMGKNHVRIYSELKEIEYVYRKPGRYGIENERYTQENIIEKVLVNKVEPLKEELKTFIACVNKGEEFPITPVQALNNLRICEEIREKGN